MTIFSQILIALVALLHCYFLVLEMFLWTRPIGLRTFNQNLEKANITKVLAANQGLYNGFLAAGLLWGLFNPDPVFAKQIKIFFLFCVIIAGIFGSLTASKRIIYIQAVPAALAIITVFIA